ncbi:UNVERIFIED_CONTAM: hypothetical protein K2H54_024142 [Gekko kuhli]
MEPIGWTQRRKATWKPIKDSPEAPPPLRAVEMWIGWAVLIGLLGVGHCDAEIIQQPSLVLQENQTALLVCHQRKGHNAMYWYRQGAGQGLEFLFIFYGQKQTDRGKISDRFRADQPQKERFNLNISLVKPEDSAIANPTMAHGTGSRCDTEITQQRSLVLQENQTALLVCNQKKGHNAMYWYRQDAGRGLEFLFYFYVQQQTDRGKISDRFRADQPEKERFNLNISLAKPEDSGVTVEMWIGWSVLICLLEVGCSGAEITQQPSLVLQESQTAQIKCTQTNGHNAMYWYRQDAGQGLQLLFSFYNAERQHKDDNPVLEPEKEVITPKSNEVQVNTSLCSHMSRDVDQDAPVKRSRNNRVWSCKKVNLPSLSATR